MALSGKAWHEAREKSKRRREAIAEIRAVFERSSAPQALKSVWLVGEMVSKMPVRVGDSVQQLELLWSEGMLGVMPVFATEGQARAYARMNDQLQGEERDVWAVEVVKDMRTAT